MLIRKTVRADEDLIDIYLYGSQHFGLASAENYFNDIHQAFLFLAENPLVAPEQKAFIPPVRIHRHARHLIIYQIENDSLLIVRVLHHRMDVWRHL